MTKEQRIDSKAFLRRMHSEGLLDLTGSQDDLQAFIQIFAGEPDALIALHTSPLITSREDLDRLLQVAAPTAESYAAFEAWRNTSGGV